MVFMAFFFTRSSPLPLYLSQHTDRSLLSSHTGGHLSSSCVIARQMGLGGGQTVSIGGAVRQVKSLSPRQVGREEKEAESGTEILKRIG